jgi:hypothetical protein
MSYVKQQEYKKKKNPYGPIIGLVIVIALGVIAYFVAPFILDPVKENVASIQERAQQPDGERNLRIVIAAFLWFIMVGIFMMISAANRGKNVVEDEYALLRPRDEDLDDPKVRKKYEAEMSKNRQAQIKALKKLQKEKDRQKRGK